MFRKHLTILFLAPFAGLGLSLAAHANPGFTVKNALKTDVDLYIFIGDETYCGAHEHHARVSAGKTHSYGCSGRGKDKCKIALFVAGEEICKSARNACSKSKIVMKDRSTVIVRTGQRNQNFLCQFR